jgi:putative membrane protein
MNDWQWHHGFGGGWFMGLIWILLIVVVLLAIYGLQRGRGQQQTPPPSAKELLKARYARGEIEREEYLQKLRDLDDASGP